MGRGQRSQDKTTPADSLDDSLDDATTQETETNQPSDGLEDAGPEREYGTAPFAPECARCKGQGREVKCVCRRTSGPIAFYYCPTPGCRFSIKVARPQRERRREPEQINVAAREDMK